LGPKGPESKRDLRRHTPSPGLPCGEPDDRLQRGIQYAAASRLHRGYLDYWIIRFRG